MKFVCLLSVLICITRVLGMPQKVSLTPLNIQSSEEDYSPSRGSTVQNLGSIRDRYPIYVLGPVHNEDRQRHSLDTLRGLNIYDLPYMYSKRFVDKKSLDSIGGGHLI